ncbi:hypothetical protein LCGC14_1885080, partial [marine sediment metagenome]
MRNIARMLTAAIVLSLNGAAWGEGVELGEPVKLDFAGATLALPKDYELVGTDDTTTVVQVAEIVSGEPVMMVTLSAYRLAEKVKLAEFVKAVDPGQRLAVRDMKVITARPIKIAGIFGEVQIQSFTNRGVKTTAVRVHVLRPVAGAKMQMGYVLAVVMGVVVWRLLGEENVLLRRHRTAQREAQGEMPHRGSVLGDTLLLAAGDFIEIGATLVVGTGLAALVNSGFSRAAMEPFAANPLTAVTSMS